MKIRVELRNGFWLEVEATTHEQRQIMAEFVSGSISLDTVMCTFDGKESAPKVTQKDLEQSIKAFDKRMAEKKQGEIQL
jgi:hypothetical protein